MCGCCCQESPSLSSSVRISLLFASFLFACRIDSASAFLLFSFCTSFTCFAYISFSASATSLFFLFWMSWSAALTGRFVIMRFGVLVLWWVLLFFSRVSLIFMCVIFSLLLFVSLWCFLVAFETISPHLLCAPLPVVNAISEQRGNRWMCDSVRVCSYQDTHWHSVCDYFSLFSCYR